MFKIYGIILFSLFVVSCSDLDIKNIKCTSDSGCPSDAVCEKETCILKVDLKICSSDSDCDEKFYCEKNIGRCRDNSCIGNEDCGEQEYCNASKFCELMCNDSSECKDKFKPVCNEDGECVECELDCTEHGVCEVDSDREYCVCDEGYIVGPNNSCVLDETSCNPACGPNQVCQFDANNYFCECDTGFVWDESHTSCVPETCIPQCVNKVCGDDGCGEVCGDCNTNETCSVDQSICEAIFVCEDNKKRCLNNNLELCLNNAWKTDENCSDESKVCDSDELACIEGTCSSDCEGKTCGPDGCGDFCGSCEEFQTCNNGGNCELLTNRCFTSGDCNELGKPVCNISNNTCVECNENDNSECINGEICDMNTQSETYNSCINPCEGNDCNGHGECTMSSNTGGDGTEALPECFCGEGGSGGYMNDGPSCVDATNQCKIPNICGASEIATCRSLSSQVDDYICICKEGYFRKNMESLSSPCVECETSSNCGDNEICNVNINTCECKEGYHFNLDGTCVEDWQDVSTGGAHTCAIRNGKLFCWGENYCDSTNNCKLGLGEVSNGYYDTPQRVGSDSDWISISLGQDFSCGIREVNANTGVGDLYCWGKNDYGQLGLGDDNIYSTPSKVNATDANSTLLAWKYVNLGATHACAITNNDALYCWGRGYKGMLGIDDDTNKHTPTKVNLANVEKVALGTNFTCAIAGTSNKKLYCWGNNSNKQLGNYSNNNASESEPTLLTATFNSDWLNIDLGLNHACASKNSNGSFKLYCWGSNTKGQLGLNAYGNGNYALSTESNFIVASDNVSSKWHNISVGYDSSCGIVEDSSNNFKLNCWGENEKGQLGVGTTSTTNYTPLNVTNAFSDSIISMNGNNNNRHTCAIISSKLYCWGSFGQGQLGIGDLGSRNNKLPILVE